MDVETATAESPPTDEGELVLEFPNGLPGFPEARRFRLRPLAGARGFAELVGLEDDVRFVLMVGSREAGVPAAEELTSLCRLLGFDPERLGVYFVVTLEPGEPPRAWVNLRAPVLVDLAGLQGVQVVLADPRYPLRCPLPRREDGELAAAAG